MCCFMVSAFAQAVCQPPIAEAHALPIAALFASLFAGMALSKSSDDTWFRMAIPRNIKCKKIEDRFPNARGVQLHRCIWKHFVQQKSFTCPWWTASGQRSIARHPLNDRDTEECHDGLITSFLAEGVYFAVSSKPVLVKTSPGADTWYAVGAGNRTDCFYLAKKKEPDNDFIKDSEEIGLEDCVQLTDDCPSDVIHLLVNDLNNFHGGAGNTCFQIMKEVPHAESSWTQEKRKETITSRGQKSKGSETYESLYWGHVKHNAIWAKCWRDWSDFEACKVIYHYLTNLKMFDDWSNFFGKRTLWTSPELLESGEFFQCMKDVVVMLKTKFSDMPNDIKKVFLFEFTKQLLPLSREAQSICRLREGKKSMAEMHVLTKLQCPMGESVMYKTKAPAKPCIKRELEPSAQAGVEDADDTEPPKKVHILGRTSKTGGKAKTKAHPMVKAKAKPCATAGAKRSGKQTAQACVAGEEEELQATTEGGREKMWLDDVAGLVLSSSKGYGITSFFMDPVAHQCVAFALKFCYEVKIDMGTGKEIMRWLVMRLALAKYVESQRKVNAQDLDASSIINQLAQAITKQATPDALAPFRTLIDNYTNDPQFVSAIKGFLATNDPSVPIEMSDLVANAQRKMWNSLKATTLIGPATIHTFVQTFAEAMFPEFPPEWAQFASCAMALVNNSSKDQTLPEETQCVFATVEEMEHVAYFRTKALMKMLAFFVTHKACVVGGLQQEKLAHILGTIEMCATSDALLAAEKPGVGPWVEHWALLLSRLNSQNTETFTKETDTLFDAMVQRRQAMAAKPAEQKPVVKTEPGAAPEAAEAEAAEAEITDDFYCLLHTVLATQVQEPIDMEFLDNDEKQKLASFYGQVQCMGTLGSPGGMKGLDHDTWKDLLFECEHFINKAALKHERGADVVRVMKDSTQCKFRIPAFSSAVLNSSSKTRHQIQFLHSELKFFLSKV